MTALQFLNQPIVVAFLTAGVVLLGYWLNAKKDSNQRVGNKVDKASCSAFRKRIGKEVEDVQHETEVVKKALVFIVAKMDGDPRELGLID